SFPYQEVNMMKCRRSVFLGLFVLGMLSTRTWAGALQAYQVINTGPFNCNTGVNTRNWTNTSGSAVLIKRAELWMGMTLNGQADFAGTVVRLSDNSILLTVGWDHYSNPTTLHQHSVKFSPDYFTINPGDTLQLQYFCNGFSPGVQGHEA